MEGGEVILLLLEALTLKFRLFPIPVQLHCYYTTFTQSCEFRVTRTWNLFTNIYMST
jgi:hypothetical protein